jgi:hypothetical protein
MSGMSPVRLNRPSTMSAAKTIVMNMSAVIRRAKAQP